MMLAYMEAGMVQQAVAAPPEGVEEAPQVQCVHHWIIDPPTERFSRGVCQKCGEVRLFRNDFWSNDPLLGSEAWR
ncbi:MAG: hypothetical protein ACOC6S_00065 [Chloroflexota bacterium]